MGKPNEKRLSAEIEQLLNKETYNDRVKATRIILRNYRALNAHCKIAEREFEECGATSKRFMTYIGKILDTYKAACENSQKPERCRRWRVIKAMYIADKEQSAEDIADREHIDRRTVFKDISEGVEDLTVLIFGVSGLKI